MSEGGYMGKILFVDLTRGTLTEESLPDELYRDFIGGIGIGVRILYERMKPGAEPLGPSNMLGFVTGPFTGTGVPGSDRLQVVGKSPITGGWNDSSHGGSFASQLKAAGYDAVFISGVSPKPVYLFLRDGKAVLRDASYLWGKDTVDTTDLICQELGDSKVQVTCIGPAGEAKSLNAAIMHKHDAAARGGLAAVMGAKFLKAIAARGTKRVPIAHSERFSKLIKAFREEINVTDHPVVALLKSGTCSALSDMVIAAEAPVKNWTLLGETGFPNHRKISDDEVNRFTVRRGACLGCPVGCKGVVRLKEGPYAVGEAGRPEYETLGMLGADCLNDNIESMIKLNDLCNRYGLDTVSVGSAIAFAMECYERGILNKGDTGGIELTWGNAAAMIAMVELMAKREGLGAALADGSKFAAEQIGRGSEKWAIHSGGQDMPAHDPRSTTAYGWGYVCDPTPGRHTVVENAMVCWEGELAYCPYPELNFPKTDVYDYDANAQIYAALSDFHLLDVSVGLCYYLECPGSLPLVELLSVITGWDFSLSEGLKAGRRIQSLRQAFNIREGLRPSEWDLPNRLKEVPIAGPTVGRALDFNAMKKRGYNALGWDAASGRPLIPALQKLGLMDLVGRLPST